jgi:hypothetical protein
MTEASGMQGMYEQWLGLLPQFLAQFGAQPATTGTRNGGGAALPFPADQIASAAAMTQNALQGLAQAYAPLLQGAGAPALLAQWAAALPMTGASLPNAGATMAFAPWLMPAQAASANAGATPSLSPASGSVSVPAAAQAALLPFQQMQRAWLDMGNRLAGGTTETYVTAFDRTFGALADALGLGPVRALQAAMTKLIAAQAAQNDSRAAYAMLVQSALASGWDEHIRRLAEMAARGERVDSMLALIRMWASATEDAVHRVLQSEPGLEATAAVTRAGLAHRKQLQAVAAIIADGLDMATRRDLDEAFREIQQLKRELRAARSRAPRAKEEATGPTGDTKRRTRGRTRK